MYFRSVIRKNPINQEFGGYYRLVESYRNDADRICHQTLLTIGFINFSVEKLNIIQRILNNKYKKKYSVFEESDKEAIEWADFYWEELIKGGKLDISDSTYEKKKRSIDTDTMSHKDVREVGSEWMCYQALEQLKIRELLVNKKWDEEQIQLALTQIISRAVYPFSEHRTTRWIKENSAICEITGYNIENITKDKLYKSALDLYEIKDSLELHLSSRTNELFDLEDKIILYDLTNTYFEGSKRKSKMAKFGRSKEKRSDAKLIVLGLVVNVEGFVKYSQIFEGNKSDSKSLPEIIEKMRLRTSTDKRGVVVLDAGIATDENCALIEAKGFDYVCVSRSKINDYLIEENSLQIELKTKNKQKISLQKIVSANQTDYIVKIKSEGKQIKEDSMKLNFEEKFLLEVTKINNSIFKKNGVKKLDKVNQRIGRLLEKYPSMNKYYCLELKSNNNLATQLIATKKENYQQLVDELGVYFIRTNLKTENEQTLWKIYNTIREIESTFRCLKTDLELRPIYHKNDIATLAHLHLGILAYWLVNTIRHQLKIKKMNYSWQEILRITNTQKIITTSGQNTFNELIVIRKCSYPNDNVKQIYTLLNYKNYPYIKRKFVVPKNELKKNETQQYCGSPPN